MAKYHQDISSPTGLLKKPLPLQGLAILFFPFLSFHLFPWPAIDGVSSGVLSLSQQPAACPVYPLVRSLLKHPLYTPLLSPSSGLACCSIPLYHPFTPLPLLHNPLHPQTMGPVWCSLLPNTAYLGLFNDLGRGEVALAAWPLGGFPLFLIEPYKIMLQSWKMICFCLY